MRATSSATSVQRLRAERGWTLWLIPKRVDLVTSAFYLSVPIFHYYYTAISGANQLDAAFWWGEGAMIGATLILLSIDRLEYWFYGETTPTMSAIWLLGARILFIEIIAQLDGFTFSPFLYFVVPLIAVLYFGDWAGYATAALAWIVYLIKQSYHEPAWFSDQMAFQYFIIFTLGLIFSITMAQILNRERASRAQTERLLTELAVSHQRLKDYTEQAEELAATKERNRLAREIHDSLGHYLTIINVQLEKALVFHDKQPEQAEQAVHNAKRLAGEALQDVRRSVSELRVASQEFSARKALTALVEHMRGGLVAVELSVEGSEEGFTEETRMALYRAAQEALTNVQKHSEATHTRVELQFGPMEALLRVSDNGKGFSASQRRALAPGRDGGYGLQGIQERLELLGGWFAVDSAPGAGVQLSCGAPRASASNARVTQSSVMNHPVRESGQ